MASKPLIAVVGADGFVGGGIAQALNAKRVVYGPPCDGDIPINQAEAILGKADIIINAGGFRVRPGCNYADYQRSHQGATSALVPSVRKGALFIHISSASVLGTSKDQKLGNHSSPNPRSFPSPAYALAKLEADQFLQRAATERGFRLIFLRPAVLYSQHGAGMIDSMIRLAKRGINLRVYPRKARHHLCHMSLLVDVVRRVIERNGLPHLSCLVVADPYTVTSCELEELTRHYLGRKTLTIPLPASLMSTVLLRLFHSQNPRLDLRTWGEILGVLRMDTEYDPSDTFRILEIDPSQYSREKTLLPLIRQALQQ